MKLFMVRMAGWTLGLASAVAQGQSMPGMSMPGDAKPQAAESKQPIARGSLTHDTMGLQEPEDPARRTGSNVSAPELLKDVAAQPAMALAEFLRLAESNQPTLAQAQALVRRSAAQARQAGLYPNPGVGYQGEQIRGGSYGGGEQGAYVQQTIVLGGKLGLRRDVYNQQTQAEIVGVDEYTYRVHNDVTQAFYAALTAQSMVEVRQRMVSLAMDAAATVRQLANVGQADAPDILQAEVETEEAKIEFVTAQRMYLQKFRALSVFAGKPEMAVAPLAGSLEVLPELDAEQQVARIVSAGPTVKRMQQEVIVSEARLREAKHAVIPDLQLRAGEQYNFEHITESPVKATGPQSFASVGVSLPLWNRNQGNIAAAQADVERARQDVLRTQMSLRQNAEPLAQGFLASKYAAEHYKTELIPRAQRAYELYLAKYQSMAAAYPQVLVSQRTLFQLQMKYLTALQDAWANAIALENFTLRDGLQAPMSSGDASMRGISSSAADGSLE